MNNYIIFHCSHPAHQKNPLNVICFENTCAKERLICPFCWMENHQNHKTLKYNEFILNYKNLLERERETKLEELMSYHIDTNYKEILKSLNKARVKTMTFYKELESLIDMEYKKLRDFPISNEDLFLQYQQTNNLNQANNLFEKLLEDLFFFEDHLMKKFTQGPNIEIQVQSFNNLIAKTQKQLYHLIEYQAQTLENLTKNTTLNHVNPQSLLNSETMKLLSNWLQINIETMPIDTLFLAHKDGFKINKINEMCNGKENCLSLFKEQKGKIFGIFTEKPFHIGNYLIDQDNKSFMFSITDKQKLFFNNNDIIPENTNGIVSWCKLFGNIFIQEKNDDILLSCCYNNDLFPPNEKFKIIDLQIFQIRTQQNH